MLTTRHTNLVVYLLAAIVGAITGLIGAAFHYLLDRLVELHSWLHGVLQHSILPGWLWFIVAAMILVCTALWLVRRFAPETAGSGIPQVEATLAGAHRLRWWRVMPVKFVAGLLAMAAGLVLGREGPTIHMGSASGQMIADKTKVDPQRSKTLIAAGAAAGLAAAFNAPLAGIMLVTEEMRDEFNYNFVSLQSVILASCMAVVVSDWWLGQGLQLQITAVTLAPLAELPLFLLLGVIVGAFGVLFNKLLLCSVRLFNALAHSWRYIAVALVGASIGALLWFFPNTVGEGEHMLDTVLGRQWTVLVLMSLLAVRTLTSVISYGTGVPGGIFAPLLALGTLLGVAFSVVCMSLMSDMVSSPAVFAVASMGALFAATVRAPLTGIVLVIELTGALEASLTIILTCMMATFTAQFLSGKPIYRELIKQLSLVR